MASVERVAINLVKAFNPSIKRALTRFDHGPQWDRCAADSGLNERCGTKPRLSRKSDSTVMFDKGTFVTLDPRKL